MLLVCMWGLSVLMCHSRVTVDRYSLEFVSRWEILFPVADVLQMMIDDRGLLQEHHTGIRKNHHISSHFLFIPPPPTAALFSCTFR